MGSGISSLLLNLKKTKDVEHNEEKMVKDVLGVLYPGYTFPDTTTTETLLTMTMKHSTQQAILDMMKTRQCILGRETEDTEFFDIHKQMFQQKNNHFRVVPPLLPKSQCASGVCKKSATAPTFTTTVDVSGEKLSSTSVDVTKLTEIQVYEFDKSKSGSAVHAKPLQLDVISQTRLHHSKYVIMRETIKDIGPKNIIVAETALSNKVKNLLDNKVGPSAIAPLFDAKENKDILAYYVFSVDKMLYGDKTSGLSMFNKLVRFSDPDSSNLFSCFLDALRDYKENQLDPVHYNDDQKKKLFESPPERLGPTKYLPSGTKPLRWSTVFRELFNKHQS